MGAPNMRDMGLAARFFLLMREARRTGAALVLLMMASVPEVQAQSSPPLAPPPAPPPPETPCRYHLVYAADGATTVRVSLECSGVAPGRATFVMPRAVPMGYGEQPYDRYVRELRAFSTTGSPFKVDRETRDSTPAGAARPAPPEDAPRWRLEPPAIGGVRLGRVEYDVDLAAMERDILSAADTSKVRPGYAGILGYSVFGYIEGHEDKAIQVEISAPEGWPAFTTLAPQAPAAVSSATAAASDFYALADSQILLGPKFDLRRTEVNGDAADVPLFVAVYGEGPADVARITTEAEVTLERIMDYFGAPDFLHYTVHMELLKPVSERHRYFFSMEHLNSATFYLDHESGLRAETAAPQVSRTRSLFAHHFAHAWIPKRAYGAGYFPHLWETAPVLDTIWFSEGFAQYAAIDALADAQHDQASVFRGRWVQHRFRATLTEVPPFMLRLPLVELSRIASTRYSEDFRLGRATYSRGGLMAAEMDDYIRASTNGQKRLR
ncbi:MAG: hypothetical protein ACRD6I_08365, partial [Candidatus Acidiferrales bacterium]